MSWLHLENILFNGVGYYNSSGWDFILGRKANGDTNFTFKNIVNISNSYAYNCYREATTDSPITKLKTLMRV